MTPDGPYDYDPVSVNDVNEDTLYYLVKPNTNAVATNNDDTRLLVEGDPKTIEDAIRDKDGYVHPDTGRLQPISVEEFYRRFQERERAAKRRARDDREE